MLYFHNDYSEGCHEKILEKLIQSNLEQTPGYGEDHYCRSAAQKIRTLCGNENLGVHFLVGGTQANLTVIAAALRPHQAALCADSGHINVHETGAVEATGHKVLTLPSPDGKISAEQIANAVNAHRNDDSFEHMAQPKLVYISNPTELGTIYSKSELEAIHSVCKEMGLILFLDGARLGYGLAAKGNDLTMADIARLCDVFYIGGTKVGALFGEAVVISNPSVNEDFRYIIKQHGGMLAKGRLLGVQFDVLMDNGLYFEIARHADAYADRIRDTLDSIGAKYLVEGVTNQIFPVLSDTFLEELGKSFTFTEMGRVDANHRAVRFCTSWATTAASVDALCHELVKISEKY